MSEDRSHRVSTRIARKLSGLSHTSNEQCIFRVHNRLRSQSEQAYDPEILSIGPYHHGKYNLRSMEIKKLMYLQELLIRRGEENADRYIIALMELEDRARRSYADEISLSEDDFVEMLCLDGLFVIEFLRKWHMPELRSRDDTIFQVDWLFNMTVKDLILFENQIPFFILLELFDTTEFPGQDNLIQLAFPLCKVPYDIISRGSYTSISTNEVIHLLGLVHKIWCSSFAINDPVNYYPLKIIKSASELGQSGIKFGSAERNASWHHITFDNGKIKIPHLTIDDHTEAIFRNLIAFEQYMTSSGSWKLVTDYARFLDHLIESPRDVEKLRHCNIITNRMGDDQFVATMFNKLTLDITVRDRDFCYLRVYKEVNEYSDKRWNIWKAHLMRNYFNSPWSMISFLAAVVLLILTFVQTIFSILAAGKN